MTTSLIVEAKKAMAELKKDDGLIINFDCFQATERIPNWVTEEGYKAIK